MCNLYSITKGRQAIRDFVRAVRSDVGNMPPLPGVFPDYQAPIVRDGAEGRELVMARWGMPSPVFALKGRNSDPGVTNIRNVGSPMAWSREPLRRPVFVILGERDPARWLAAAGVVRLR
jgi:putative SOS response-associated peptidase YedK